MCLLMDKTDYQIPGTLEFGNLFWSFATFKNTAGRSEVLPGATKKERWGKNNADLYICIKRKIRIKRKTETGNYA